jgi:organic hydroperoxide reductase OsmC/OhrA
MHTYTARITWDRNGATFTGGRYSRGHEWSFDGGVTVPASASPSHVPAPYSVVEAVDPEEALVAAASSCHMLMFLFLAAKRRLIVDSYVDEASGVMEQNAEGRLAFSRITLRPQIRFAGDVRPPAEEVEKLHHAAHDECYVANSLKCDVAVEPGAR